MKKNPGTVYTIENSRLRVRISTFGAEPVSFYDKVKSRELLWQTDINVWDRQSPLPFPIVNMIRDNAYTYRGKPYRMEIHGFAYLSDFALSEKTGESAAFVLTSNETTRIQYPFDFALTIRYSLDRTKMRKEYIVTNTGREEMIYNAGGHEGWALALEKGEKMGDYWLLFDEKIELISHIYSRESGIITDKKSGVKLDNRRLFLKMENLVNNNLTFSNISGKYVELHGPKTGLHVRVRFADFTVFGLWTANYSFDTNFICIEPHMVLPDCEQDSTELTEKKRYRRLPAGQTEILYYSVEVD